MEHKNFSKSIKKVVLSGPESTGKTFLSQKLATHFHTVWVEEYGRAYCQTVGQNLTSLDFAHIAGGQIFLEDEAAKKANVVLFCDTDLIVTQIWAEIYKVECPGWVIEETLRRHYDLFLLLAPDVAWERDGLREYPHIRNWHYERLKTELEKRKVPLVIISGDYESRMQQAIGAVEKMLNASI